MVAPTPEGYRGFGAEAIEPNGYFVDASSGQTSHA